MSAYILSDNQINHIVSFARGKNMELYIKSTGEHIKVNTTQTCQQVATILLNENVRSVNYRYGETTTQKITFSMIGSYYYPQQSQSLFSLLKLLATYEYQACETSNWQDTDAYLIIQWIKDEVIKALPGYSEAPAIR